MTLTGATWVFFLGFAAYDLALAYRDTKDASFRNRLRYLFLVLLVIFGGTLTNLDPTLTHFPGDVVFNIISAMLITFAILRHQLLDISIVLSAKVCSIPSRPS